MSEVLMDMHLHFDLYKDRSKVLSRIESNCSHSFLMTNLPSLFEKYNKQGLEGYYGHLALGFHPELAAKFNKEWIIFQNNINRTRIIGEIGLDFTKVNPSERQIQLYIFKSIVALAEEKGNKILSIHSRKAERQTLDCLDDFHGKVILHWYTGLKSEMKVALGRGYYFSVNINMTYSKAGQEIIQALPIENILIESDAPFTKGMKEEYDINVLKDTILKVSQLKNIELNEFEVVLKQNLFRIFSNNFT